MTLNIMSPVKGWFFSWTYQPWTFLMAYISRILSGLLWLIFGHQEVEAAGKGRYGYFAQENSSYVLLQTSTWDVLSSGAQTEISFRTCDNGELLYQSGGGDNSDFLQLSIQNGTLAFNWSVGLHQEEVILGNFLNNNVWWTVTLQRYLGNLSLNISLRGAVKFSEIISNSTFRTYFRSLDLSSSVGIYVGRNYTGCLLEGPNVIFINNPSILSNNVEWSNTSCSQTFNDCPAGG